MCNEIPPYTGGDEEEEKLFPIHLHKDDKRWDLRVVIQIILKKDIYSFEEMKRIREKISEAIIHIATSGDVAMTSHSINL